MKPKIYLDGEVLMDGLERLLPCPFCGKGTTEFIRNGMIWMGMRFSEPVSISINHWCEKIEGQPHRPFQRIGKDRESAIGAWNMRSNVKLRGAALLRRPASTPG